MTSTDVQPKHDVAGARPIRLAQLGGCNMADIVRYVPGAFVSAHAVRCSTASLVSEPLDRSAYKVPSCPLKAKFVEADFQKKFFGYFEVDKWDVLLLDLLRDYHSAAVRVGGTYVTEINHLVHGEPLQHDDVFVVPYEVINWRHPDFWDLWTRSAQTFYERLLKPALDEGRYVAMAEILPTWGEYRESGEGFVVHPDHGLREFSETLARMYGFFAGLDSRIIRLKPEPEFAIGAFDTVIPVDDLHFLPDFHARAGELLSAAMGIAPEITARHIAMERLRRTRATYEAHLARETALKRDVAAARHDAERAALWAESTAKQVEHLRNDLSAARANVQAAHQSSEVQAEAIAALTARLTAEQARAEAERQEFAGREAELNAEIAVHRVAFAALQREHEHLVDAFQDHIGHYDALREELERKNAADDISYELALDLTRRLRAFADRRGTLAVTGNAAEAEAERALRELSQQLEATKGTVASLVRAVSDLDTAPAAAALAHDPAQQT